MNLKLIAVSGLLLLFHSGLQCDLHCTISGLLLKIVLLQVTNGKRNDVIKEF